MNVRVQKAGLISWTQKFIKNLSTCISVSFLLSRSSYPLVVYFDSTSLQPFSYKLKDKIARIVSKSTIYRDLPEYEPGHISQTTSD